MPNRILPLLKIKPAPSFAASTPLIAVEQDIVERNGPKGLKTYEVSLVADGQVLYRFAMPTLDSAFALKELLESAPLLDIDSAVL